MRRRIVSICLLIVLLIGLVSAYSAQAAVVPPDDDPPPTSTPPNSTPAPDSDGDGVPNAVDQCPNEHGTQVTQGCPDRDWDGTRDSQDNCPNDPGPMWNGGCPIPIDNDGDGVPNLNDNCPYQPGPASNNGCPLPDADGDTIIDVVDNCPAIPNTDQSDLDWDDIGDVCDIDKDGDGITVEGGDICPSHPGPRSNNGCPVVQRICAYPHYINGEIAGSIIANVEVRYAIYEDGTFTILGSKVISVEMVSNYVFIDSIVRPDIKGAGEYAWMVQASFEFIANDDRRSHFWVTLNCGEQLTFSRITGEPTIVDGFELNGGSQTLIQPPTPTPTSTPTTPIVQSFADVNIRSGDNTNYPIMGLFSYGSTAPIIGISPIGWYYIQYGDIKGFVINQPEWVRVVSGNISNVPVTQPPGLPTPTPTPNPTLYTYSGECRTDLREVIDAQAEAILFAFSIILPPGVHELLYIDYIRTGLKDEIVRQLRTRLGNLVVRYDISYTYNNGSIQNPTLVITYGPVFVGDNFNTEIGGYDTKALTETDGKFSFEYIAKDVNVGVSIDLEGIGFSPWHGLGDLSYACNINKQTLIEHTNNH